MDRQMTPNLKISLSEAPMFHDIRTFMDACNQTASDELATLYLNLVKEELGELNDAIEGNHAANELDSICDTIWTLVGYAVAKGYPIEAAWDAVALANLRKIDLKTGRVNRRADGKILKPEGWKPPNIARILDDVGYRNL